ncbi:hypothetical protein BX666DRAFT_1944210 [Dichotomocladium elegans]|nr:hypothetical protein BX666DRAFT_1944210 [Dichotomocladium elegans]
MKISDILNPFGATADEETTGCMYPINTGGSSPLASPPLSPHDADAPNAGNYGKPRNRFSEYEDAVICQGVAKGLTWGQISGQLPHRKRATCFNRYRTLQGIRKSRKIKVMLHLHQYHYHHQNTIFTPSPSPPPLTPPSSTPSYCPTNNASDNSASQSRNERNANQGNKGNRDFSRLVRAPTYLDKSHHHLPAQVPSTRTVTHEKHHHHMYERD